MTAGKAPRIVPTRPLAVSVALTAERSPPGWTASEHANGHVDHRPCRHERRVARSARDATFLVDAATLIPTATWIVLGLAARAESWWPCPVHSRSCPLLTSGCVPIVGSARAGRRQDKAPTRRSSVSTSRPCAGSSTRTTLYLVHRPSGRAFLLCRRRSW